MVNILWGLIFLFGIFYGILMGHGPLLSNVIVESTNSTVKLIIELIGVMSLWCGIMKIAEKSGLTDKLAKILKPILKLIFKDAGKDNKALGAITMNLTANMMGLSNAATPFGIKAMKELKDLSGESQTANNDMVLFLVLNAACIQLMPTTVMSIRAAVGSKNPAQIILPAIIATSVAALTGIVCCKILQKYF